MNLVARGSLLATVLLIAVIIVGPGSARADGGPGVITADGVRLRAGPGADKAILGQLNYGDQLTLLERSGDGQWWRVRMTDGRSGWVSAGYISTSALPQPGGTAAPRAATGVNPAATANPLGAAVASAVDEWAGGPNATMFCVFGAIYIPIAIGIVIVLFKVLSALFGGGGQATTNGGSSGESSESASEDDGMTLEQYLSAQAQFEKQERKWAEHEAKREEYREEHGRDPGFWEDLWL